MTYDEFLNFLNSFNQIKSFSGKIESANKNLTRIGSGSGRIVFDIDGDKAFKLAKNQKGIAQNEVEVNVSTDYYAPDIITKVYEYSEDFTWIIAEKAKKVSKKRIEELTGIPSLDELYYYLRNFENKGKGCLFSVEPEIKKQLDGNEFVNELLDLMSNYNITSGDLGKPSTYGEVLRGGQSAIVISDYGLNDEVYATHYSPQRMQKHKMYEIYNFADGNDDILLDANGSQDIRRGMWALMPQGVGDGDESMDDEFISYIQERNKYPSKPISNILFLNNKFHECVNNLKETLNKVDNKKIFYNNLLALQEYLISQGIYDREKIELQEYEINENSEIPVVKAYSLDDEPYARQLVNNATAKLGLKVIKYLGGGSNGFAYDIGNGKVFKISADVGEADAASKLLRENPVHIAKVYNLYKIVDTEKNLSYFGIIEENVQDKQKVKFNDYYKIINMIMPNNMSTADFLIMMKKKDFNYNNLVQLAQGILDQNPEANISPELRQEAYNYLVGLFKIKNELLGYGIKSNDYGNPENIGYSDGVLKYFDFGAYRAEEPNIGDNVIMLPENIENIDEEYERNAADSIANQICNKFNLNRPVYISGGTFGIAYDIGNDLVLKITKDKSEASENLKLIGKQLNHIAKPFRVFEIKSKNDIPQTYAIILEKLQTSPEIERLHNRLNFAFGSILDVGLSEVVEEYLGLGTGDIDKNIVDNYLRKNPQDAKFFNGLFNIAKEVQGLGIESMDFYNWRNLGYKKNGVLGFFDVGFGNGFLQPHEVETMEVSEVFGGSSLYSTNNTVGTDNTPAYNQNDTSPLTDNNIPTSIENLTERILSAMKGSSTVNVKKKCRLGGLGNTSTTCNQGDINNLNIKPFNEEIDASEARDNNGAINAMINGRKDVSILHLKNNGDLKKRLNDLNFGLIKINQDHHDIDMHIIYRKTPKGINNAQRLYNIMKNKGGYVSDETPKEAYEIGKLLDYSDESIKKYINLIYIKEKNGTFRRRNNDELRQYDMENERVVVNENNIMALKDLPFKQEVEQLGGKIYSVGGAVRDEFLGKESKDLDILISGIPMDKLEEILGKYGRVDAVGKSFGILKFKPEGSAEDIDIAIPRTEKPTGEGGHKGFEVSSSHELPIEKDLERRDFTINAIAKDSNGNIIDPYGGQKDLQNKIIRIVNPEAFSDDPLRMLRAVQFASRFGFKIEPNTLKMIQDNASRIKEIPPERILTEFEKIVKNNK